MPNEDLWCHLASRCTDPDCWLIDRGRNYWNLKSRRKLDRGRIRSRDLDPDHLGADDVDRLHVTEHLRDAFQSGELRIEYRGTVPYTTRARQPRASTARISINNPKDKVMADVTASTPPAPAKRYTKWEIDRMIHSRNAKDPKRADVPKLTEDEARSCALKVLEDRSTLEQLGGSTGALDALESVVRNNDDVARRLILTENVDYKNAFKRYLTEGRDLPNFTDDERKAVIRVQEYQRAQQSRLRAQNEGTSADGGFVVPPTIDPSIVVTDGPSPNPYLTLCTVHEIETLTWKGLASVAPAWSSDAEGSEVSDDSLTGIAQPSIPTHRASAFIPYTIETSQDWPDFAENLTGALSAGYTEYLVDKFSRGVGTTEPTGILTALAAASPSVLVTSATDGTFTDTDVNATWNALPARFRANAVWMASTSVTSQIRMNSTLYHASTVQLDGRIAASEILMGHQLVEMPYFPTWTSTTGSANRLIVGDWSNFAIVQRRGMSVEVVPTMIATANNLPSGQRGLFATARVGSDCLNANGFRMQSNV